MASQVLGTSAARATAWPAWSTSSTATSPGATASGGWSRTRSATRSSCATRSAPRAAGPSASPSTRTSRTPRRPCWPRWGATGGPRAPPRSSWTRARARSSPSPTGRGSTRTRRTRRRRGDAEPGHGGQLRAGLHLQGDHGGRRAGGEHGHARHRVDAAADHPRGRPRRQRVPRPRLRHAHHARHPRAVLERRGGQDRRDARRAPLRPLGAAVRLRPPDRRRPARARSAASCSRSRSTRASPWATCRSARASRSRRSRWPPRTPRSPTAASCARRTSWPPSANRRTPLPKGRRVISEPTAASVRRMLEGVLGPGGTASGAHIDGYVLAGKTGTAEKADETRRLLQDQVRRLLRRLRARRATPSCSSP